jgi:hypothetical protein
MRKIDRKWNQKEQRSRQCREKKTVSKKDMFVSTFIVFGIRN